MFSADTALMGCLVCFRVADEVAESRSDKYKLVK